MDFRLATFNLENLFTRFDFEALTNERSQAYLPEIAKFLGEFADEDGDLSKFDDFKRLVETAAVAQYDDKRQHTALAMAEADPHVFCLQEVDDIRALERFRDVYLNKTGADAYPQLILFEGNDRRGIDVAAMARDIRPLMSRSHAWITPGWFGNEQVRDTLKNEYPAIKSGMNTRRRVFSRDCLELEFRRNGKELTIFNCHFKSMSGGRDKSIGKRQLEALAVRELIKRKFPDPAAANWIVVGDLNDYRMQITVSSRRNADGSYDETVKRLGGGERSGVDPLLDNDFGFNTLEMLPEKERWTHFYADKRTKTQLDYIIVSPALKDKIEGAPRIVRSGQPYRTPNTENIPRYPRIGHDRPKASDHCPVVVTLDL